VRSTVDDLALARIDGGALAADCPVESFGQTSDAEDASFDEVLRGGASIGMEYRPGTIDRGGVGQSRGLQSIPLVFLGRGDVRQHLAGPAPMSHTFSARAADPRSDRIVEGLSGGPIMFRGSDKAEAGPLGIEFEVLRDASDREVIVATRMSVARAFFEAESPSLGRAVPTLSGGARVVDARGVTLDTACGPLNILDSAARCGWKVRRSSVTEPIKLELDLGSVRLVTGIRARFATGSVPRGIAVSTSPDNGNAATWVADRYCTVAASATQVDCSLGERSVRLIVITVDGAAAEIRGVDIETVGATR
jgi:hypothetical protein